jgi:hypothetical protein
MVVSPFYFGRWLVALASSLSFAAVLHCEPREERGLAPVVTLAGVLFLEAFVDFLLGGDLGCLVPIGEKVPMASSRSASF